MDNIDNILENRRKKANKLEELGWSSFPNGFEPTHTTKNIRDESDVVFKVGGRLKRIRRMGKLMFCDLWDRHGKIQLQIKKNIVGEDLYNKIKLLDIGDIVFVEGKSIITKSGELSLQVANMALATKSLHPLPDKHSGIENVELKYRQRYVDLISNEKAKEVFKKRTKLISYLRSYLDVRDFMEVETPILHDLVGGANAKPFMTYHNTLDMDLFCRIAPELYLKRLIVGGFERVYEIGRNFRNEGLSTHHNPEFTMLEFYQAWATYETLMDLTENMLRIMCLALNDNNQVISYKNEEIDFGKPFKRISIMDGILKKCPDINLDNLNSISQKASEFGINTNQKLGKIQMDLFEKLYEDELFQPTFVMDFPADVSPLARKKDSNPKLTDRFELYIGGHEIANGYSEINDPDDQRKRFEEQLNNNCDEMMDFDEDYIHALEIGMPPTAGEGIGIDRLCMVLTDSHSIRDVILFPQMRKV